MKDIIIAKNLSKTYGDLNVLKGISLSIKKSEVVAIVGPSGAGKTTLLQLLGTLTTPDKSDQSFLEILGQNTLSLHSSAIAKFRNETLGFIFQFHELLDEFTAIENVLMPALIARKDHASAQQRALDLLTHLGIQERKDHKPTELSGGEQQRVAIARALMNEPAIIFADEPSGNLDSYNATALHELFFKLRDEFGQTFVIVTHNKELARMADRTITLKDGQIVS